MLSTSFLLRVEEQFFKLMMEWHFSLPLINSTGLLRGCLKDVAVYLGL